MQRKIEITTDRFASEEGAPELAPDAVAPEFADNVIPADPPNAADGTNSSDKNAKTQELDVGSYITALQNELEEARGRMDIVEKRAADARKLAEEAEKKLTYLQADFQNYRRRRDEERGSDLRYANAELLRSLLPIMDNFERALSAAEQTKNFDALIAGVSGTLKQLQAFLQKAGVTTIEAVGKEFDPNFHEAIGHTETDEYPANTVAEEVQRGYILHDKVLRPTLVRVTQD